MANIPVVGDKYTAVLTFTNRSNVPINPVTLTFYYRTPITNQLISTSYATTPSAFRNPSVGHWEFDFMLAEYGTYHVRCETDLGVIEGQLTVQKSGVL